MIFQPVFTTAYSTELWQQAKNNSGLERYAKEQFEYDSYQTAIINKLEMPKDLLRKMIPTVEGDCDSAIALYEAYPGMTPFIATDSALWVYLAHVDLFHYMQNRYAKVKEEDFCDGKYVMRHWFTGSKWQLSNTLGALWWIVHMTIDKDNQEDKYKYTRQTFEDTHYRTNFLNYTLARNKATVFGLYDFLNDNPEIKKENFRPRFRFMTKYLNRLGGVKLISGLPRDYFYNELMMVKNQVLAIIDEESNRQDIEVGMDKN